MALFTIFDSQYNEILKFSPENDGLGNSVSIGISPLCAVSLGDIPNIGESVKDIHFSLIKQEGKWYIVNPGNEVQLSNGQPVEKIQIIDGMEIMFGSCRMSTLLTTGTPLYEFTWKPTSGEAIPRVPLTAQITLVGSAQYCDIVINSPEIAPEHIKIHQDNLLLSIEELNSGRKTTLGGKDLIGKTKIVPDRLFHIGTLPAKIITTDMKDADISFSSHRISWKSINIFLLAVVLLFTILSIYDLFMGKFAHSAKKLSVNTHGITTRQQLIESIKKDISVGAGEKALENLVRYKKLFKEQTEWKELQQLLSNEVSAENDFNFYKAKVSLLITETHQLAYIKFMLKSEDSSKFPKTDIAFWNNVLEKLRITQKQLKSSAIPVFKRYKISSYFLSHFDVLKKLIQDLIHTYSNYMSVSEKWDKEQWNHVIENLNDIKHNRDSSSSPNFNKYIDKIIEIARLAKNINELKKEIATSSYEKYNADTFRQNISNLLNQIHSFESLDVAQFRKDKTELNNLLKINDALASMLDLLRSWEKEPDNFTLFHKLTLAVDRCSLTSPLLPVVKKAIAEADRKMRDHIDKLILSITPAPDRKLLAKCAKIEDFVVAAGSFNTGVYAQKLQTLRNSINSMINKKCDALFEQFQEARNHADKDKMKSVLNEILKTAPVDSKYYSWAAKTMNKL